jgi:hypothetical protein
VWEADVPAISATTLSTLGFSILSIDWTDAPTVTFANVIRTVDGIDTVVRMHTFVDPTGAYIELSGGLAVIYDTEAPFNTPITYTTTGLGSALTASITLTITNAFPWLKSPLHPWADKQLVYVPISYTGPECLPGDSIVFAQMGSEVRSNRTTAFFPNNAEFPIPASRTRASIQSTLRLVTRTFTARDSIITLNAPGDPLLFQIPAVYGIPDRYMTVGDYTVDRFSADHKVQWRANTLPHTVVQSPPGLAEGVLGVRWADLCDLYVTFDDANTAGLTWTEVLLGQGVSPPLHDFCSYDDLAAAYATYNAMTAANVDYNALEDC